MTQVDPSICPTCDAPRTIILRRKREQFVCEKCDADPFKSPKMEQLLKAVKPPAGV